MKEMMNYNKKAFMVFSIVVECSMLNTVVIFSLPAGRQGSLQMSSKI